MNIILIWQIKYVAYGLKHQMFIVGHTLIWHSQLSPFVKNIQSSDSLLLFMTNHINTVLPAVMPEK